jgi:hypothetical protein
MSFFKGPITNTKPEPEPVDLPWLVGQTRTAMDDPELAQWIAEIRFVREHSVNDADVQELLQAMKCHLPYQTIGGTFERRSIAGLLEPSGYTGIDLDKLQEQGHTPEGIKEGIRLRQEQLPWAKNAYKSVGEDGIRVIIELSPPPRNNEDMRRAYRAGHYALSQVLGIDVDLDTVPSSIASPSYQSYDEEPYYYDGPGALLWELVPVPAEVAASKKRKKRKEREYGSPPWKGVDPAVMAPLDREALQYVKPSDDYHDWLGRLPWLQSLGFSLDEVDAWSRQGVSYRENEVTDRWNRFPGPDDPDEARRKLWAEARRAGWKQPDLSLLKGRASAVATDGTPGTGTLQSLTRPSRENATEAANSIRFLVDHSDRLVVAYDPDDLLPADVYAYTEEGTLAVGPLEGMLLETSRRHMELVQALPKGAWGRAEILRHARILDDVRRLPVVIANVRAAIALLRKKGFLPTTLVIKRRRDINASLRYLGTPKGVLDLYTGQVLPPDEARATFTAAQIPDDYDPEATHPDVDVIMPEVPTSPEMEWWYRARGLMFTRGPEKEFVVMLTPPDSGKTVIANADRDSFGEAYVSDIRPETLQKDHHSGPTSYNDGLLNFGNGMRMLFVPEGKGTQNTTLLNLVTGGERSFLARGIKEKEVRVRATAHLVMQANLPEGGEPEIQFGVAGRSDADAAAALRERMYLLPMPRIPQEQRNPAYLSISADGKEGSQEFRQAWVARTVRQCMAMVDQPWPARLGSQARALADLQHRETDAWLTEWLENALVYCAGSQVHSKEVYADYEAWYEENGGEQQTQRAVTQAATEKYGPGVPKQFRTWKGKRSKVTVWCDKELRSQREAREADEAEGKK